MAKCSAKSPINTPQNPDTMAETQISTLGHSAEGRSLRKAWAPFAAPHYFRAKYCDYPSR
jgi:hypothetical protein